MNTTTEIKTNRTQNPTLDQIIAGQAQYTLEERRDIVKNWQIEQIEGAINIEAEKPTFTEKASFLLDVLGVKYKCIRTTDKLLEGFDTRSEYLSWEREAARISKDIVALINKGHLYS